MLSDCGDNYFSVCLYSFPADLCRLVVDFKDNIVIASVLFSKFFKVCNSFVRVVMCAVGMPVNDDIDSAFDCLLNNVLDKRLTGVIVWDTVILNAV